MSEIKRRQAKFRPGSERSNAPSSGVNPFGVVSQEPQNTPLSVSNQGQLPPVAESKVTNIVEPSQTLIPVINPPAIVNPLTKPVPNLQPLRLQNIPIQAPTQSLPIQQIPPHGLPQQSQLIQNAPPPQQFQGGLPQQFQGGSTTQPQQLESNPSPQQFQGNPPPQQFQNASTSQQFQGGPPQQFQGGFSPQQLQSNLPPQQLQGGPPTQQLHNNLPPQQFQSNPPPQQFQGNLPPQQLPPTQQLPSGPPPPQQTLPTQQLPSGPPPQQFQNVPTPPGPPQPSNAPSQVPSSALQIQGGPSQSAGPTQQGLPQQGSPSQGGPPPPPQGPPHQVTTEKEVVGQGLGIEKETTRFFSSILNEFLVSFSDEVKKHETIVQIG
jgi:hypothetical protein